MIQETTAVGSEEATTYWNSHGFMALSDIYRSMMAPVAHGAEVIGMGMRVAAEFVPHKSIRYALRTVAAHYTMLHVSTKTYKEPGYDLDEGQEVSDVLTKDWMTLKQFKMPKKAQKEPILVVLPMAASYPAMGKNVIKAFLEHGHPVFATHWIDPSTVPVRKGTFGLNTYTEYLLDVYKQIGDRSHVVSICQGGPASVVSTALTYQNEGCAPKPKTLTVLCSPLDTRINPGALNRSVDQYSFGWVKKHLFDVVPFGHLGAGRKVYSGDQQRLSLLISDWPIHKHKFTKWHKAIVDGDETAAKQQEEFYKVFMARMPLDRPFAEETLLKVFIEKHLPQNIWKHDGQEIDTRVITDTALGVVEGEKDGLTPPGQTAALFDICSAASGAREHIVVSGAGHYSTWNGSVWRHETSKKISDMIEAQRPLSISVPRKVSEINVA